MTSKSADQKTPEKVVLEKDDGLIPGKVSEEQFRLLMQGTSIRGEGVIAALHDHLVNALTPSQAWTKHNVNKGQFSRRLDVLLVESERVRKLSKFYRKR